MARNFVLLPPEIFGTELVVKIIKTCSETGENNDALPWNWNSNAVPFQYRIPIP